MGLGLALHSELLFNLRHFCQHQTLTRPVAASLILLVSLQQKNSVLVSPPQKVKVVSRNDPSFFEHENCSFEGRHRRLDDEDVERPEVRPLHLIEAKVGDVQRDRHVVQLVSNDLANVDVILAVFIGTDLSAI